MRGKKIDSEFLSDFIAQCIRKGLQTPEAIVANARSMIESIDEEIKRVEKQKIVRSKLLDVISTFDKPTKTIKPEEVRALSFFKIQQPVVCKHICDRLKVSPCGIEGFGTKYSKEDIMFCVKQLLENKVVAKSNNFFLRGELFDEYLKFALRE